MSGIVAAAAAASPGRSDDHRTACGCNDATAARRATTSIGFPSTCNRASDGDSDDGGPGARYTICAYGVQFPSPPPSSQSASDWDMYVWLEFGNVLLRLGSLGFAVRWRPKRLGLHMLIGWAFLVLLLSLIHISEPTRPY